MSHNFFKSQFEVLLFLYIMTLFLSSKLSIKRSISRSCTFVLILSLIALYPFSLGSLNLSKLRRSMEIPDLSPSSTPTQNLQSSSSFNPKSFPIQFLSNWTRKTTCHENIKPQLALKLTSRRIISTRTRFQRGTIHGRGSSTRCGVSRVFEMGVVGPTFGFVASGFNGFSIYNHMVGCEFVYQIWSKLEEYFTAHTRSKIK